MTTPNNSEMLRQIAALAGAINKKKQAGQLSTSAPPPSYASYQSNSSAYYGSVRGSAVRARGRGRGAMSYRNLSLKNTSDDSKSPNISARNSTSNVNLSVAANSSSLPESNLSAVSHTPSSNVPASSVPAGYVKKGNSLILATNHKPPTSVASTASAFQTSTPPVTSTTPTLVRKGKNKLVRPDSQNAKGSSQSVSASKSGKRSTIKINDVEYIVSGKKLIRKEAAEQKQAARSLTLTRASKTPKRVTVNGKEYVRTVKGNLIRADLVRTAPPSVNRRSKMNTASKVVKGRKVTIDGVEYLKKRNGALVRLKEGMVVLAKAPRRQSKIKEKQKKLCMFYSRFGECKNGEKCRYLHDPDRIAICRAFLRGTCPHIAGSSTKCLLSHDPTPNRVPICTHFERSLCTNETCPYRHIKYADTAKVCRDFVIYGYCDKGAACQNRHVWECPDFNETGTCKNEKCKLPHIKVLMRGDTEGGTDLEAGTVVKSKRKYATDFEPDFRPKALKRFRRHHVDSTELLQGTELSISDFPEDEGDHGDGSRGRNQEEEFVGFEGIESEDEIDSTIQENEDEEDDHVIVIYGDDEEGQEPKSARDDALEEMEIGESGSESGSEAEELSEEHESTEDQDGEENDESEGDIVYLVSSDDEES